MPDLTAIDKAVDLMRAVYAFSVVAGNAHVVVDDGNMEDAHIRWCLDVALPENIHEATTEQLTAERECLEHLLSMSQDDREIAWDNCHAKFCTK